MINILFVETGTFGGGSFESLFLLLKHMDRNRYNPFVLFLNETKYLARVKGLGVRCFVVRDPLFTIRRNRLLRVMRGLHILFSNYLTFASAWWEFAVHYRVVRFMEELVSKYGIDVVHSNDDVNRNFFCTFVAKSRRVALTSHVRTFSIEGFNRVKSSLCNRYFGKYIAISRSVKEVWKEKGLDEEKFVLVHNGIQPENFEPMDIRKELAMGGPDARVLGAVGTYSRERGFEFLLAAFAGLVKKHENYRLVIIGDDNQRRLGGLVRDLGLGECVTLLDHVDRAIRYIAAMDILVIPYNVEPFGRVLLEAWMVRTPVIISEIGYIRDVVEAGRNCILVEYGNVEQLSGAIEGLLEDRTRMRAMADEGLSFVQDRYGVARYVTQVGKVLDGSVP